MYLHERFGVSPSEPLASEVEARLDAMQVPVPIVREVQSMLDDATAARFGRGALDVTAAKRARTLVQELDRYR
jgi:hypothetical protein